jgi:hypothetical protein
MGRPSKAKDDASRIVVRAQQRTFKLFSRERFDHTRLIWLTVNGRVFYPDRHGRADVAALIKVFKKRC